MRNRKEEFEEFEGFKRRAKENENYYITVFYEGNINTINISELGKEKITFGKSKTNNIVIESDYIDKKQGYFEISESGVQAVNTSKRFTMISNGDKPFSDIFMEEGEFIKIVDSFDVDYSKSVLLIMSIGENSGSWKTVNVNVGISILGSRSNIKYNFTNKWCCKKTC